MATAREAGVPVVALFGPTGLGKTAIAVQLALLLDAEIVSADSMQVYSGLAILANQPTDEQRAAVPHHLIGVVDPREEFSVAAYARLAHEAIDDIRERGRRVILEGGSGLYMRAGLGGLAFGSPPDPALRAELEELGASDPTALLARLGDIDPDTAAVVDGANPRRVSRALEVVLGQSAPLTEGQRDRLWRLDATRHPTRLFALDVDRVELRRRVEDRVDAMFAAGLVDEVARLPRPLSRTVRQAIGVDEVDECLAGSLSLDEAAQRIKARTRRYVRRQLTWMRKTADASIIATSGRPPADVALEIEGRLL